MINSRRDERGMRHVWGGGQDYKGLWWESLKERDHLENVDVDGRILELIFRTNRMSAWSGQEQGSIHPTPINRLFSEFPSIAVVLVTRYSNDMFTLQLIHQLQ
jgi:hypothetical protein